MIYFDLLQPSTNEEWEWDTKKQLGVKLSDENRTVTKVTQTGAGLTYGNIKFETGSYHWKIDIKHVAEHYWICVGIVDEAKNAFQANHNYAGSWCISSYGEVNKLKGKGSGIMLSAGDQIEMDYDADSGEFNIEVEKRGIKLTGKAYGTTMRPFAYVWTVGDSITLSFD